LSLPPVFVALVTVAFFVESTDESMCLDESASTKQQHIDKHQYTCVHSLY